MFYKYATHFVKSHVDGTSSGLYYRYGEALYPIIGIGEGRLINIPVGWTNNGAIEVFKLVHDESNIKIIDWDSEPLATHCAASSSGELCWYSISTGNTYKFKREISRRWSSSSALLHTDSLIKRPR